MLDTESDENQIGMFSKGNWSLLGKQISPVLFFFVWIQAVTISQSPNGMINDPVSHDTMQCIF